MITLVLALAIAAPNPSSIDGPRRGYATCLKTFESKSRAEKVNPAAYATAIKAACPTEAAALMRALVAFDVAMGNKRASATANAQRDIDDYQLTSEERYRDLMAN
ncbi:MAG: hypothetical protein ACR2FK_00555 [Sphingomicrobium sp.]